MNNLMIFENQDFGQVRMTKLNNKTYAVANDVLKSLGYAEGSWRTTLSRKCKGVTKCNGLKINGVEVNLIPEGDIYRLIVGSHLPQAEKFESWVFDEVLPQIRKTGGYIPIEAEMSEAEIMAKALLISQRTIEQKDKLLKEKEVELVATKGELEDKNRFIGQISASKTSMLVRDVAHLVTKNNMKIGEKRLWIKLREWGLIFKESTKPKQRALEQGLFEVSQFAIQTNHGVTTKATTRVTAKGQVYIINRLLKEGI